MSRLTRVLVLGAMLGAMSLSVTAIAQAQTTSGDAVQQFRQGERDSQEQAATSGDAVQRFRQGERAFQEQAATSSDAVQRFRQGERTSLTQPTVPVPAAEPTGQPNWLVPALGVLVAVLALGGGPVAMARRTRGKIRPRQAV
jgi:chemotaxis response regulator CheB